jgi:hypothetical protein
MSAARPAIASLGLGDLDRERLQTLLREGFRQ